MQMYSSFITRSYTHRFLKKKKSFFFFFILCLIFFFFLFSILIYKNGNMNYFFHLHVTAHTFAKMHEASLFYFFSDIFNKKNCFFFFPLFSVLYISDYILLVIFIPSTEIHLFNYYYYFTVLSLQKNNLTKTNKFTNRRA